MRNVVEQSAVKLGLQVFWQVPSQCQNPINLRQRMDQFSHHGKTLHRMCAPHEQSDWLFLWQSKRATRTGNILRFESFHVERIPQRGGRLSKELCYFVTNLIGTGEYNFTASAETFEYHRIPPF